jgi:hypothetical protein
VVKKRKPGLLVLILLSAGTLYAQVSGTKFLHDIETPVKDGKLAIFQSDDIFKLIDRHLFEESKKQGIVGYRIRIFSNSGARARKEGEDIMARFLQRFDGKKPITISTPLFTDCM